MSLRWCSLWCVVPIAFACGTSNSNPGASAGGGGAALDASLEAEIEAGGSAGLAGAAGAAGAGGSAGSVDAGMDATPCGTSSDPENCGTCGHSCLGGKCQSGKCNPVTLAVLDSEEPSYVTTDATNVYFSTTTALRSVPKDASAGPMTLASVSGAQFRGLDQSGSNLYVADSTGAVYRAPISGGTADPSWTGSGAPETLVVVSPYVYWADPQANAIVRVAQTGGASQLVSSTLAQGAYALTRDDQVLYWVRRHGVVARLDLTTTTGAVKIGDANASGPSAHVALAVRSGRVWFSYGGSATTPPIGLSVPATGGAQTTFTNDTVWGIAVDADDVYWSRVGLSGSIKRRTKSGSDPEDEIVSGLTEVRSIALDGDAIYFSEYDASSNKGWIKKLAK